MSEEFKLNESKLYISVPSRGLTTSLVNYTYVGKLPSGHDGIVYLFDKMRKTHFDFRQVVSDDIIHQCGHGCLKLSLISLDDFIQFELSDLNNVLETVITKNFHDLYNYPDPDEELADYPMTYTEVSKLIRDTKKLFSDSLYNPTYCCYLKEEREIDESRKTYFRNFYQMTSFIFFGNNGDPNSFLFVKVLND